MKVPQHSSASNEHYTPAWLVNACMDAFKANAKGVDHDHYWPQLLDPASSSLANAFVRADQIFTKEDDGLTKEWDAITVFCNPPGGKTGNKSNQNLWAKKFCEEYESESFLQGVFVAFNPELLFRMGTLWVHSKVVMIHKRVHYLSEYKDGILKEGQWSQVDKLSIPDADKCLKQIDGSGSGGNTLIFDKENTGCKYSLRIDFGKEESDTKFYRWTDSPTHSTALVFKGVTTQNIQRAFEGIEHTIVQMAN